MINCGLSRGRTPARHMPGLPALISRAAWEGAGWAPRCAPPRCFLAVCGGSGGKRGGEEGVLWPGVSPGGAGDHPKGKVHPRPRAVRLVGEAAGSAEGMLRPQHCHKATLGRSPRPLDLLVASPGRSGADAGAGKGVPCVVSPPFTIPLMSRDCVPPAGHGDGSTEPPRAAWGAASRGLHHRDRFQVTQPFSSRDFTPGEPCNVGRTGSRSCPVGAVLQGASCSTLQALHTFWPLLGTGGDWHGHLCAWARSRVYSQR